MTAGEGKVQKAVNCSSETQKHFYNKAGFLSRCLPLRLIEAAQTNRNIFIDCEVRLVLQGSDIGNIWATGKFLLAKLQLIIRSLSCFPVVCLDKCENV